MVYKLIKTDNYLLVVDDSVHPYDSSKVGNPLAHLPINGSPILEGVDLLDVNLILNYLKEFGYWNDFCTFAETFYNEKKHNKDTN